MTGMEQAQPAAAEELVYISAPPVSLTLKGRPSPATVPGVDNSGSIAELRIACEGAYTLETLHGQGEASVLTCGSTQLGQYRLPAMFFEQTRYELILELTEPGHTLAFDHENPVLRRSVTRVGRNPSILSGILSFGSDIGLTDLHVLIDGRRHLTLTIEVFPSKLSYREDYRAIVSDITSEVYSLVFDFLKRTYDRFGSSNAHAATPAEFFAVIRTIYREYLSAVDLLLARPHHVLRTEHEVVPAHRVKRTDARSVRWLEKHPEQLLRRDGAILAARAPTVKRYVTFDTRENRLARFMLERTVRRLQDFGRRYAQWAKQADEQVMDELEAMVRGLRRRLDTGFLREVKAAPESSGMSLVFGMAPGYRELYRLDLLLRHGLSVSGELFRLSVKDLAVLYEYWCFIKLNSLMRDRYRLLKQDVLHVDAKGISVSLVKGRGSSVRYLDPESGELITLSYNPKAVAVPTVAQRPDNVLRLQKRGAHVQYEYVFDAKYRIDPAVPGSAYAQSYGTPGPKEEDINTMHRYRDAIVYTSGAEPYERTMFGAYVLFPYHDEQEYRRHRFYRSIEQVNIGALPFLPSATALVKQLLDELITDTPESAFERATLPKGIEERLARVDWSRSEVLIALMSDEAQLERALAESGCSASVGEAHLPIRYVALYEAGTGIRLYGEVQTAAALPQGGYRFTVDRWQALDTPIAVSAYGPSPVAYTNLFLLTHSRTYPELHLRSEWEYRFLTELRRRTEGTVVAGTDRSTGFELDGVRYLFEGDTIHVLRDGRQVDECELIEFARNPNAAFRRLRRRMED